MKNNKVIKILFSTPGVVNVSDKDDFEPQPGVFASIYINLKTPLLYPKVRKDLTALISKYIGEDVDYICGIESGGSYYASAVADITNKKIILYRKERKKYNIKNHFVGNLPQKGDSVVIIDDVISSGNTISNAVQQLQDIGCKVEAITVFSYCWDQQITKNLNIKITTLSNAEELIQLGLINGKISIHNAQIIRDFIKREENRLVKGKNV